MMAFYELRMLNKMDKYSITKNAQTMLKAHSDWKTGMIDEAELGRRIRLSPENRRAVIQTMVKIPNIMQKKPEESKFILAIIEICGEIVSIADKPPPSAGFPSFLKLPSEIRHRVYEAYLQPLWVDDPDMVLYQKKGDCDCAPHVMYNKTIRNISLAFTSRQMRNEVLAHFYRINTVYFSCCCEMGAYLREDSFLREHIRNVKVQWWGAEADKGLLELGFCSIESLTVSISRLTMKEPTKREKELRDHFSRPRSKTALPESLGFEELSALRGLTKVNVVLAEKLRTSVRCTSEDQAALLSWLKPLKEPAVKD